MVQNSNEETDLVDAYKEFCVWTHAMKGTVTMVTTGLESVCVHGAFAKCCQDIGIHISPSAPYLKEMNVQPEGYFAVVMNMERVLLKTSTINDVFWRLTVYHVTYLENHLPSSAPRDRTPYDMVFRYSPDLLHLQFFLPAYAGQSPASSKRGDGGRSHQSRQVCRA